MEHATINEYTNTIMELSYKILEKLESDSKDRNILNSAIEEYIKARDVTKLINKINDIHEKYKFVMVITND